MEVLIGLLGGLLLIAIIGSLGMIGEIYSREEARLKAIQDHYRCDADDAVQLLYYMRKAKVNHVLKKSGLTL